MAQDTHLREQGSKLVETHGNGGALYLHTTEGMTQPILKCNLCVLHCLRRRVAFKGGEGSMAEVEVTDANFRQVVLEAKGPVMVDFWAAWCGPCRMLAPIVEQIAEEYEGKLTVAKLNVDENPQTAAAYNVMSIPTLIVFRDGQPVQKVVGYMPKEELVKRFSEVLVG